MSWFTHHPSLAIADIHPVCFSCVFPVPTCSRASPRLHGLPSPGALRRVSATWGHFLDDSNPTITLTRLTVTTLMPSIIQNTCDFLWLSPYVFHSWFLQPFLQNQEARKGVFWEADVILFLDFDIWTFLYAIFISQQSYLLKNRKEI